MRLELEPSGAFITFTPKGSGAGPYDLLLSIGILRVAARAGQRSGLGVGESPSVTVRLDNNERQAAKLLGNPLRVIGTLRNDDGSVFFTGAVARVGYGRVVALTLAN